MAELPAENSAGIACNPARLNMAKPSFRIALPSRPEDRDAVLAAIVPDGSLRIIYIPYGDEVESFDIITPSKALDWPSAQRHNVFDVDVRSFDALVPDANAPSQLFGEGGIYQFALVDGIPYEIPTRDSKSFQVTAGCVVQWSP